MTYRFLLFFAFVWTISYHNWFVYLDLYSDHWSILPAAFYNHCLPFMNAHIMLLRYVICNYIWHMTYGKSELCQKYESLCMWFELLLLHIDPPRPRPIIRWSLFLRRLSVCLSVRPKSKTRCNANIAARKTKFWHHAWK